MRASDLMGTFVCMLLLRGQWLLAAPVLEVSVGTVSGGAREWKVRVAPDAELFANTPNGPGKSLALELAFDVNAGSIGGQHSSAGWVENPGLNPFTGGVTDGVDVDNTMRKLFAALGGSVLASDQLVDFLGFETTGAGPISLTWGGHTLLPGTPYEYTSSRIAQAGMNFDGYQGMLVSDGSAGLTMIDVPSGRHTAVGSLPVAQGSTLIKKGAGILAVGNVRAAGLSVTGGTVEIAPNGASSGVSVIGALSIAGGTSPTAKLDVANNAAVINYTGPTPAATVRAQIIAGRGGVGFGQPWNGPGITSSAAAAANVIDAESRSVGYAENGSLPLGAYTMFGGQPVDDTSLLIAYVPTGDANLDGVVNDDDVTIVSATYAPGVPQPSWALGDFDYNGFVDDDDVTLLGVFYDPTAAPLPAPAGGQSAAVPEPRTIALLGVMMAALAIGAVRRGLLK